jgi:RHS repeat-associated protein
VGEPFVFTLYDHRPILYLGDNERFRHVELSQFERVLTERIEQPCAAVRFVEAAMAANVPIDGDDATKRTIARAERECARSVDFQPAVVPEIHIEADPPSQVPSSRPPGGADSAESLVAPPPTRQSLSAVPTAEYVRASDRRPLSEQYADANHPLSDAELADLAEQSGGLFQPLDVVRNLPPPGQPTPGQSPSSPRRSAAAADPVILFSGQYELQSTDVQIPSRGLVIALERTYRSGGPRYFGPFGYNWDHSYNIYLRPLEHGAVAIWTGRLTEQVFEPTASGFEPPAGVFAVLERATAPSSGWVMSQRGGIRWLFDTPEGWPRLDRVPLVAIEDAAGNRLRLGYDAEGRLSRVRDFAERGLRFRYGGCALLEQVEDHTGRVWQYWHDEEIEHLVAVVCPGNEGSPGPRTCFEYDTVHDHHALVHNITRVVDALGRVVVENRYGTDPASPDFNRVVRQYYAGTTSTFAATPLRWVPPSPLALNIPALRVESVEDGVYHVYTFNWRGDLLDHRFRLVRDRTYRLVCRQSRYDRQGNPIEVQEPDGVRCTRIFDVDAEDPRARGNLLRVTLHSPVHRAAPPREVLHVTWEPRYQQPKWMRDEANAITRYFYDYEERPNGAGNLLRVEHAPATLPDGTIQHTIEEFDYNRHAQVTRHTSATGILTEFRYSEETGYLESVVCADRTSDLSYDARGNTTEHRIGGVLRERREWDALDRLTLVEFARVNGQSGTVRHSYDAAGFLTSTLRPRGACDDAVLRDEFIRDVFEHNAWGHLVRKIEGENTSVPRETRLAVTAEGLVRTVVDVLGRITRMHYNERGLLLRQVRYAGTPNQEIDHLNYDLAGRTVQELPAGGGGTHTDYDAFGRPFRKRAPLPNAISRVEFRYGPGDCVTSVNFFGSPRPGRAMVLLKSLNREYDIRGRLQRITYGSVAKTFWHDADDRLVRTVDQRGAASEFGYNSHDEIELVRDALGNVTRIRYDSVGNTAEIREEDADAGGGRYTTSLEHDDRGRVVRMRDPLGNIQRREYDDRDLTVACVDSAGRRQEYAYGAFGAMLEARLGAAPGHRIIHRWAYDPAGRLIRYIDPEGSILGMSYGLRDEWTAMTWPDGSAHQRSIAEGGRVAGERARNGVRTVYEYGQDGLPQVVRWASAGGPEVLPALRIGRDGLGRIVELDDGRNRQSFAFDSLDRLTLDGQGDLATRCEYDDLSGTRRLIYSDGRIDEHELDLLGRVARIVLVRQGGSGAAPAELVGRELAQYRYRGAQRLEERRSANGASARFRYDAAGRLTAVHHYGRDLVLIASVQWLRDRGGRRAVELRSGSPARVFSYDDAGRITLVHENTAITDLPNSATQEEADLLAERIRAASRLAGRYAWTDGDSISSVEANGGRLAFESNAGHQVTAVEGSRFAYSTGGSRTRDDRYQYRYDALERIIEAQDLTGTSVVRLQHDAGGRVFSRTGPAGSERWVHFGSTLIEVVREAGSDQLVPGASPGELLMVNGDWCHQDERLSLIAISGSAAERRGEYRYNVFGVVEESPGGASPKPVFAGHRLIAEDLFQTPTRVLDARTFSFLQPDPEIVAGSPNPYSYGRFDPINYVDPCGGLPILLVGAVAGAVLASYAYIREIEQNPGLMPTSEANNTFSGVSGAVGVAGAAMGIVSAAAGELVLARFGLGSLAAEGAAARASSDFLVRALTGTAAHGLANVVSGGILAGPLHVLFPNSVQFNGETIAWDAIFGGGLHLLGRGAAAAGGHALRWFAERLERQLIRPLHVRAGQIAEEMLSGQAPRWARLQNLGEYAGEQIGGLTGRLGRITMHRPLFLDALFGARGARREFRRVFGHEFGHRTAVHQLGPAHRNFLLRHSEIAGTLDEAFAEAVARSSVDRGLRYGFRPGSSVIERNPTLLGNSFERLTGFTARNAIRVGTAGK